MDDILIPNTYVTVETDSAKPQRRLQIRDRGLVDLPGGGSGLWIVDEKTMKVRLVRVKTAGLDRGAVSVTGDLKGGELYVYEGKQKLFEDACVKLAEVE